MELNANQCYRAMLSRDRRFDGRFFTAVITTGIYCRPICPSKPKRKNIRFFSTAAAAESEGFRPCLRCRPEAAAAMPAFTGLSETVLRAMNFIDSGFLDERSVAELASQFHLTERHLRRLFEEQLGANPVSIALTRRLHFARKLLEETQLSITEIAFASGFSSLRRFNSAFKGSYAIPPSQLRNQLETGLRGGNVRKRGLKKLHESNLQLKLAYRPPFSSNHLLQFLGNRAIQNVEWVSANSYR